jgi:hypothetical protein
MPAHVRAAQAPPGHPAQRGWGAYGLYAEPTPPAAPTPPSVGQGPRIGASQAGSLVGNTNTVQRPLAQAPAASSDPFGFNGGTAAPLIIFTLGAAVLIGVCAYASEKLKPRGSR